MPRKPRLHVPGGLYHVILRGNNRRRIFFANDDWQRWTALVAQGLERYECRIHAYCWMTNHVHMAIQINERPLGDLMRWLGTQYARTTNKRISRTGHLFERRHRAILVDADAYLLMLVRYIHYNPVRAGLVTDPAQYQWSSHRAYLGQTNTDWLTTYWVLSMFAADRESGRRRYGGYMSETGEQDHAIALIHGGKDDPRLVGDDAFAERALGPLHRRVQAQSLDELIQEHCLPHGLTDVDLASNRRLRLHARIRAQIINQALTCGIATLAVLSRRFNRAESTLYRSWERYVRHNKSNQ
jgi:putative transposase